MNLEQLNNPAVLLLLIAGLTVGFNQVLKKMGLAEKWCPLVNIGFGGGLSFLLLNEIGFNVLHSVIIALMIGLSAGGFYDIKKVFEK